MAAHPGSTPLLATVLLGLLLPGCATRSVTTAPAPTHLRTELFLGTLKPDGTTVSQPELQRFIDIEVTPRFPAGFTLLDAQGWWRSAGGTTARENSRILLILHTPRESAHIEAIRNRYRQRFQQESVLEVITPVKASF